VPRFLSRTTSRSTGSSSITISIASLTQPLRFSAAESVISVQAGMVKDASKATEWKKYRVTAHTHNPVDDARGNAGH